MARGRMLNQSIAEDAEFNEMSLEAQLIFLRTVPFLDRDGLINGNPSVLRGRVAPLLDLPKSMASIVDEWINAELVIRYATGKQIILFFPSFAKNQIGMRYERETASTYPPPPGYKRTPKGLIAPGESQPQQPPKDDADTNENVAQPDGEPLPDDCRQPDGNAPDDCRANGIEKNRREEKETTSAPAVVVGGSELPMVTAADVHTLWQSNMPGTLSPIIAEELDDLIETYTPSEVDTAIRLAVSAGKRNIRYVNGILKKRATGEDKSPSATQKAPPVGVSGNLGFSLNSI